MPGGVEKAVIVRLPWPPSVNHYYGHRAYVPKNGSRAIVGKYVKRRGKDYHLEVVSKVGAVDPIETRVNMELLLLPPDRRERDVDNILKALFDALQFAGVYRRDSQVRRLLVEWGEPIAGGEVVATILPLATPQMELMA